FSAPIILEAMEGCGHIAEINRKHAKFMEGLLGPGEVEKFKEEFNRQSYPMPYRRPFAAKAMHAALAMQDLTEGQGESIRSIREVSRGDLARANESWARAIDKVEEGRKNTRFALLMNDEDCPGLPASGALMARVELNKAALEKLVKVLTAAQRAQLP